MYVGSRSLDSNAEIFYDDYLSLVVCNSSHLELDLFFSNDKENGKKIISIEGKS